MAKGKIVARLLERKPDAFYYVDAKGYIHEVSRSEMRRSRKKKRKKKRSRRK